MSEPPPDQESVPTLVLEIDHRLNRTALHEALDLLSSLARELPRRGLHSDLVHRISLRITHFLLHSPCPDLERGQVLALHRFHQHHLAQALCRAQARDLDLNHFLAQDRSDS